MPQIEVYTTEYCSYCNAVKNLLNRNGVPFVEIDVSRDPGKRVWLVQKTGQRTVPQVFVNGVSLGGHSEILALQNSGKLNSILGLG